MAYYRAGYTVKAEEIFQLDPIQTMDGQLPTHARVHYLDEGYHMVATVELTDRYSATDITEFPAVYEYEA